MVKNFINLYIFPKSIYENPSTVVWSDLSISPKQAKIFFLVLLIYSIFYFLLCVPVILDDAFVYFRVIERFVRTGTPAFNYGDISNITTSPLWFSILALNHFIFKGISIVLIAKFYSIGLLSGGAYFLYIFLKNRLPLAAPFSPLVIFFSPYINTLIGHDTALAIFCILGLVDAFSSDRRSLPIWMALLYLARGEGAIFDFFILCLSSMRHQRGIREQIKYYWFYALVGIILALAWHLFNYKLFGVFFPSTLFIKQLQVQGGWTSFLSGTAAHIFGIAPPKQILFFLPVVGYGLYRIFKVAPVLFYWPILHFIIYSFLSVPNYHWYYYPIDFIFSLATIVAISSLTNYWVTRGCSSNLISGIQGYALLILILVAIAVVQPVLRTSLLRIISGNGSSNISDARFDAYRELSLVMPSLAGKSDFTLLTHEIGIIGYMNPDAHIRDVVGLATPVTNKSEFWNWGMRVAQFHPDLLLWPFANPPKFQAFNLNSTDEISLYSLAAVASNGTTYSIYKLAKDSDVVLTDQIGKLKLMLGGVLRAPAPMEVVFYNDTLGLFMHAPSAIKLDVPKNKRSITLGFGYKDGAWQGENSTDGAVFNVKALDGPSLFSIKLDPKINEKDRGVQLVTFNIPTGVRSIELIIDPGETTSWDWTYWLIPIWSESEAKDKANQLTIQSSKGMESKNCPSISAINKGLIPDEVGWVDSIRNVKESVELRGWAADLGKATPAKRIIVVAGGLTVACKALDVARPDVVSVKNAPSLLRSGFEIDAPKSKSYDVFAELPGDRYGKLAISK